MSGDFFTIVRDNMALEFLEVTPLATTSGTVITSFTAHLHRVFLAQPSHK